MFHPELHNAMELEALVQQMGFLPFFRCAVPQFSIEEFTPGQYWFVDGVDGPWECQRRFKIVGKRRRNFVVFRRGG